MKALFVLNDAPYGSEHTYNTLRWAGAMTKQADTEVRVFLFGDAVLCAKAGQQVPEGFYNLQLMLDQILRAHAGNAVGVCSSCLNARGITDAELMPGAQRSSLNELCAWTAWADKVMVI